MGISASIILTSLISGDMPLSDRLETLNPYFHPPFGSVVTIDNRYEKGYQEFEKTIKKLYGHITVTPPKGHCFTITTAMNKPDIKVCKQTKVKFNLLDFAEDGGLNWMVDTGADDFGTPISWKSSYRRGSYVNLTMDWPGHSKPIFSSKCRAVHSHNKGKKVYLKLVTGEEWIIKIPTEEHMVTQPKDRKIWQENKVKVGGIKYKKVNYDRMIRLVNEKDYQKHDDGEWVPIWQIPLRNTYEMSSSNFMPFGDKPKGSKSKCRYRYSGKSEDPKSGLLECHETAKFKWVYLAVPCLSDLLPEK